VQGVSFRYYAKAEADSLGLQGYIKNLPDGSVYVEVEGSDNALSKFVTWCHDGPKHAQVREINVDSVSELKGFKEFEIQFQ